MTPWREMAQDAGLHTDAGITLDEAAAWVEQRERRLHDERVAEREAEEEAWREAMEAGS